jgi:hypothetical protein
MHLVELQHRLTVEAQAQDDRKVKPYLAASSHNSCQRARLEALSKLGGTRARIR